MHFRSYVAYMLFEKVSASTQLILLSESNIRQRVGEIGSLLASRFVHRTMAPLQDIVAEGVTAFASPPTTSYRYVIELKSDEMSIWMEDLATKKQWYKGDMVKGDYVSPANAIPDASATDYVQCFRDSLNSDLDDASDVQRKLIPLKGGALCLVLAVTIRVLRSNWVAKYTFDLDPVSVERIDVLESKLRDVQDELEKLRGGQAPPYVKLTATKKHGNAIVCWSSVKSDEVVSTGLDGVVKVLYGGVYSIGATVTTTTSGYNQSVQLLNNGKTIQAACPPYAQGYNSSTRLCAIERLEKNDVLTVSSLCGLADTSYLSIVRLGN
ncbi:uncharacterized protein KRP23_9516 [Phytophthora ramorum]|uniref:uncharacterized protein n=1 Tax=Phytophthora ramorum TaxID=164328 RepID=UPI0030AEB2DC|nr:hypothetical protein KRP23_9516 [Phytophthora ramorum]